MSAAGRYTSDKDVLIFTGDQGIEMFLGPLESLIMECLWDHYPKRMTSKRIVQMLQISGYDYALTTITTTVGRLVKRGLIVSDKPTARCFAQHHRSSCSKNTFIQNSVRMIIRSIHNNFPEHI